MIESIKEEPIKPKSRLTPFSGGKSPELSDDNSVSDSSSNESECSEPSAQRRKLTKQFGAGTTIKRNELSIPLENLTVENIS